LLIRGEEYTLKPEQVVDAHYVVLACNPCHDVVDQKMQKEEAEKLLDKIVQARGW
jgi:predicted metal-binding protein